MKPTPTIKPRHVLCLLCPHRAFGRLTAELEARWGSHGFKVDREFSNAAPDARMLGSFEVCRDRVAIEAWLPSDDRAVAQHGAVRLSKESSHPTDSFKFNPFGIAKPRQ